MSRPSDWYVLDLDGDPTPGDPQNVETLATRFLDFADVAERSYRQVTSMAGDSAVMSWVGQSGDAFRNQFGEFPGQLRKLYVSHEMCGEALTRFAPVLSQAQSQADRALADGREARAQLVSATSALSMATDDAGAAAKNADKLKNPGKDTPEPDKEQVAQAVRDAQVAQQRQSDAQGAVSSAQGALDAAKSLAEQARQLRDGASKEAVRAINEASDAGIKPRNFWQKLADFFKGLWEIICKIAEVLAIVFGVLAIIFGGPFAWIALIAGAVLLVKAIVDFASGKGNVMDLVFGILGVIPGIKGLTTVGKVGALFKQGGFKAIGKAALSSAKDILKNLVNGLKNVGAGLANIVKMGFGDRIGTNADVEALEERRRHNPGTLQELINFHTEEEIPGIIHRISEILENQGYRLRERVAICSTLSPCTMPTRRGSARPRRATGSGSARCRSRARARARRRAARRASARPRRPGSCDY